MADTEEEFDPQQLDPSDPLNQPGMGAVSDEPTPSDADLERDWNAFQPQAQQALQTSGPADTVYTPPQAQPIPTTPTPTPPQERAPSGRAPSVSERAAARTPNVVLVGEPQPVSSPYFEPDKPSWTAGFLNEAATSGYGMLGDIANFGKYLAGQMGATGAEQFLARQRDAAEKAAVESFNKLSPEDKASMGSSLFGSTYLGGQVDPTTGQVPGPLETPSGVSGYVKSAVATAIPSALLFFLPGGVAGKLLTWTARALRAGETAAGIAGTAGSIGGTVGAGGAVQAGAGLKQLETEIQDAPLSELQQTPAYNAFRGQGLSDQEARQRIFEGAAGTLAAEQFALGGATALGLRQLFPGGRIPHPTGRVASAAAGAGEGAALMGTQVGGGVALQQANDPLRQQPVDWTEVAKAAGVGAFGGAALGGVLGGAFPGRRPGPTRDGGTEGDGAPPGPRGGSDQPPITPAGMTPDVELAMRIAAAGPGGTPLPVGPAGPGGMPPREPPPPPQQPPPFRPGGPGGTPLSQDLPSPGGTPPRALPLAPPPAPPAAVGELPGLRGGAGQPPMREQALPLDVTQQAAPQPGLPLTGGRGPAQPGLFEGRQVDQPATPVRVLPTEPLRLTGPMEPARLAAPETTRGEGFTMGERPVERPVERPATATETASDVEAPLLRRAGNVEVRPSAGLNRAELINRLVERGYDREKLVRGGVSKEELATLHDYEAALMRGEAAARSGAVGEYQQPRLEPPRRLLEFQPDRTAGEGFTRVGEPQERLAPGRLSREQLEGVLERGGASEEQIAATREATREQIAEAVEGQAYPGEKFEFRPATEQLDRKQLIDALLEKGVAAKTLNRMSRKALQERYDRLTGEAEQPQQPSKPPPTGRLRQKVAPAAEPETPPQPKQPPKLAALLTKAEAAKLAGGPRPVLTPEETRSRLVRRAEAPAAKPEPRVEEGTTGEILERGEEGPRAQPEVTRVREPAAARDEINWADVATSPPELARIPNLDNVTNRAKAGRSLELAVRAGQMSAQAARELWDRRFGKSPKAELKSFADYLDRRIAYLEDPNNEVAHATTQKPGMNPAQVKAFNLEAAAFHPENVADLRYVRDLLNNKPSPDRVVRDMARAQRQTPEAAVSPLAEAMRRLPVNDRLLAHFDRTVDAGSSVHDALDMIANDPATRAQMPWVSRLARDLRQRLPADFKIYSPEAALRDLDLSGLTQSYVRRTDVPGSFYPASPSGKPAFITMRPELLRRGDVSPAELILHEAGHASLGRYLDNLQPGARELRALDVITKELSHFAPEGNPIIDHALANPNELHTMLRSSPELRELASSIRPSPEFRVEMAKLGYGVGAARSMWQVFTGFVRRFLGLPEKTTSLLDHVLRPLDDISRKGYGAAVATDRAYQASLQPKAYDFPGGEALRRIRDRVGDYAREPTQLVEDIAANPQKRQLWDKVRKGLLQGITGDLMVSRYGKLFTAAGDRNLLQINRSIEENIRKARNDVLDRWERRLDPTPENPNPRPGLLDLVDSIRGSQDLQRLMLDNTMNRSYLGVRDPEANAHLTAEERGRLPDLERRYNNLSPELQATYRNTRDLQNEVYAAERSSRASGLVNGIFRNEDGFTDAQRATMTEALRTKRGVEQLLRSDDTPVAQALGEQWAHNRKLVRAVAALHNMGFVEGDYFPLRRFGDYVLRYGSRESGDYGVEMFESLREAQNRQRELLATERNPTEIMTKSEAHSRTMVDLNSPLIRDLNEEITRRLPPEQADVVRDLVANQVLQHMTRSERTRTAFRREYVQGASDDMVRGLTGDLNNAAFRIASNLHGPERAAILGEMHRHVATLGRRTDPVTGAELPPSNRAMIAQDVLHEIELRRPQSDNADAAGVQRKVGRITQLSYVHSLLSVSSAIANSIESHVTAAALIGGRHGVLKSAIGLARATNDMLPTALRKTWDGTTQSLKALVGMGAEMRRADWQMADVFRERLIQKGYDRGQMTALFDHLKQSGLLNASLANDLRRFASSGGQIMRGWDRFMDATAVLGHVSEEANKAAIAKTAFDLELRKNGGNVQKAIAYADEQVRLAVPNFQNKGRLATAQGAFGRVGPAVFQFRNYGLHMYSLVPYLFHQVREQGVRGEAAKSLALMIGSHALVAGALGWTSDAVRLLGGIYDLVTPGTKHPHDYHRDLQRALSDFFGPTVGEFVSKGALYGLNLGDFTHRIGPNNALNFPDIASYDTGDLMQAAGSLLTGATGASTNDMLQSYRKAMNGDFVQAIGGLLPRFLRDPVQAGLFATRGITDVKGKIILPANQLSAFDIGLKGFGVQPPTISRFRDERAAATEVRLERTDARSQVLADYVEAVQQGTRRDAAQRAVQQFNIQYPRTPIKPEQLRQALQNAQQAIALPGTGGLRVPRQDLPMVREATRFVPR